MITPKAPLIIPPNVNVLAEAVIVGVVVNAIAPVPWVNGLVPV